MALRRQHRSRRRSASAFYSACRHPPWDRIAARELRGLNPSWQTIRQTTWRSALCLALACIAACGDKQAEQEASARAPVVTIGEDQLVSPVPPWRAPTIEITDANAVALRK